MKDRWLTTAEASELSGVPVKTLYNWRHIGQVDWSHKIGQRPDGTGGRVRWDRRKIEAAIDAGWVAA